MMTVNSELDEEKKLSNFGSKLPIDRDCMNWNVESRSDATNQKAAKTKIKHGSPKNSTNRGRKTVMLTRCDFLTGSLKILRRSCGNPARINLDVPVEVTSTFYQRYARVNRKQGKQCERKTEVQTHNKFKTVPTINPTQINSLVSNSGLLERLQVKRRKRFQTSCEMEPQFNSRPCSEFSHKRASFPLDDVVNIADNVLVEQYVKGSDVNADGIPGNVKQPFELTVFLPGNNDLEVLKKLDANTFKSVSNSGQGGETELALKQISKSAKGTEELFTDSTSQTLNGESHVNVQQGQVIRRAFRLQFQNIQLSPSYSNTELSKRTSNNNCFPGGFHSGDNDYKRSARDTEEDDALKSRKSTKKLFPITSIQDSSMFIKKKSETTDSCHQEVIKIKLFKMEPLSAQCFAAVSRAHEGLSRFVNKKGREDIDLPSTETNWQYIIKPSSNGIRVPNRSQTTWRLDECRSVNMSTCASTTEKKESIQNKISMNLTTKPRFHQWSDCRFLKHAKTKRRT